MTLTTAQMGRSTETQTDPFTSVSLDQEAPRTDRSSILESLSHERPESGRISLEFKAELDRIADSLNLSDTQRNQINQIFSALKENDYTELAGRGHLVDLLQRDIDAETLNRLISQLHSLATQDLIPELTNRRTELLASVIKEVAHPELIHQGNAASCVAYSAEVLLTTEQPDEYARLLTEMATTGQCRVANGNQIMRLEQLALFDDALGNYANRTLSMRMFQSSAMQFAVGYENNYDPIKDITYDHVRRLEYQGLFKDQAQKLYHALFNRSTENTFTFGPNGVSGSALLQAIERDLGAISGVMTEINVASSGPHVLHEVTVLHIDRASGMVSYLDGRVPKSVEDEDLTSRIRQMPIREFESILQSALIQSNGPMRITPVPEADYIVKFLPDGTMRIRLHERSSDSSTALLNSNTTTLRSEGAFLDSASNSSNVSPDQTVGNSFSSLDGAAQIQSDKLLAYRRFRGGSSLYLYESED